MSIALLTALALAQSVPNTARVIYPCFPELPTDDTIQVVTHSATFRPDKTTVTFESLSTLRNAGDHEVKVTVQIPVRGRQVPWTLSQGMRQSVLVDKKPVPLKTGIIKRTPPSEKAKASGIWAQEYERLDSLELSFKPKETHSLTVNWRAPIGWAGLDGAQRMLVYDTAGAANWVDKIGQVNVAIQYKPSLVLQVYAALPSGQWQVGRSGAFWKANGYTPPKSPELIFTYYPASFDPIGGG